MTESDVAFLFPGYGVQTAGMGQWLFRHCDFFPGMIRDIQHSLDVPYALEPLLTSDTSWPDHDELAAQIAIYLVNAGYDRALHNYKIRPSIVYGYSSGIYSALSCCGAVSLRDGLGLVCEAYRCMKVGMAGHKAGMLAITGLVLPIVQEIMAEAEKYGVVVIANTNSDRQFFLSGDYQALEVAYEKARRPGLLNIRWLPVSIPYHSPLLQSAAAQFNTYIRKIELLEPDIPLVCGSNGAVLDRVDQIRELLVKQLVDPVDFPRSLASLLERDVTDFWEVGHGSFLAKLLRREQRVRHIFQAEDWLIASHSSEYTLGKESRCDCE
ncbi:ACP S-malonyltransferase [bacterium]|nr:ACP S-malonyltransferase [bacterium]